jgi:hypothetical protein
MTLGGLVKHLALVEADWLAVKLAGQEYGSPWDMVDFDADPDWEWRTGALDSPDVVGWRDQRVTVADEPKVAVRAKLSALWAALVLLYVYADVLSLFRPGQIEEMSEGRVGPTEATQATCCWPRQSWSSRPSWCSSP